MQTGTMLRQEGGVLVNARVVGMQTRIVVCFCTRLLAGRPYWS
ncbi:FlgO family outer membrane protein [Shewanella sp. 10N.286.48.B5]